MKLTQMGNDEPQFGEDGIALHGNAGHLAELADDHQPRYPGHVADEHRMGKQVGQEPEPRHPADQADRAHRKG